MTGIYDYDFCREKGCMVSSERLRLASYQESSLIKRQKEIVNSYCRENCIHPREEFIEWLKTRQAV